MKKVCYSCKKEKCLERFAYHPSMKSKRANLCKLCATERACQYYKLQKARGQVAPGYWKNKDINITPEEYKVLFDKQDGYCLICFRHQKEFKRALCVDHDHKTNKIRGFLCGRCNGFVLPVIEKYKKEAKRAYEYLQNY